MAAFQLTVWTAVCGYHVYREVWVPTVDEEFDCRQEADNREDKYAVAIYEHMQSSSQILRVSFMFLEHDSTITGRETGNSSWLASTRTELFHPTNFRALWRELEKPEMSQLFRLTSFRVSKFLERVWYS